MPEALSRNVCIVVERQLPLRCGTRSWTKGPEAKVLEASELVTFLYASKH